MHPDDEILERFAKVRTDPVEFLACVNTLDQVDRNTPIKPFPIHLPYIRLYVRIWQRERLIACPKSRRMKMSWTNIALHLWDTMWGIGRHHGFVSKKEPDSDELVDRAKIILEKIDPKKLPPELIPKWKKTENMLEFPEIESRIQGFASGADQLRQFTLSGILGDEMAFWENAQLMYSNSYPTIEGGGRFTVLSSVAPSFFQKIVFDTLDLEEGAAGLL
jgi:hypothetical protein